MWKDHKLLLLDYRNVWYKHRKYHSTLSAVLIKTEIRKKHALVWYSVTRNRVMSTFCINNTLSLLPMKHSLFIESIRRAFTAEETQKPEMFMFSLLLLSNSVVDASIFYVHCFSSSAKPALIQTRLSTVWPLFSVLSGANKSYIIVCLHGNAAILVYLLSSHLRPRQRIGFICKVSYCGL